MPLTHVVLKPVRTTEGKIPSGRCVDARDWRTVKRLEDQRYVRPLAIADEPVQDTRGGWWVDAASLKREGLQQLRPTPKRTEQPTGRPLEELKEEADSTPKASSEEPAEETPEPSPERETAATEATPTALKLAAEEGIDLATVAGSGKNGKVTKADVQAAVDQRGEGD